MPRKPGALGVGETGLQWLVRCRSAVQKLCLELYELDVKEFEPPRSHIFQLLVGAAFSLWRAVFLTDDKRDEPSIHSSAGAFLEVVIRTNMVSFGTDQTHSAWVFGYYLNNAFFRLDMAYQKAASAGTPELRAGIRECVDKQRGQGNHDTFGKKDWELALKSAQDLLVALQGMAS